MAKNNNVPERLILRDYGITYKNFSGRQTDYNRPGNRNFSVILDDETADDLISKGWNVRIKEYDDGSRRNTLQVAVRYDIEQYAPLVVMVTPKGKYFKRQTLTEDTVATLDSVRIATAHLDINPSSWRSSTGHGIKAYLTTGYFVVEKDIFEDEFPEEDEVDGVRPEDVYDEKVPF